jgi:hypothetical protein
MRSFAAHTIGHPANKMIGTMICDAIEELEVVKRVERRVTSDFHLSALLPLFSSFL